MREGSKFSPSDEDGLFVWAEFAEERGREASERRRIGGKVANQATTANEVSLRSPDNPEGRSRRVLAGEPAEHTYRKTPFLFLQLRFYFIYIMVAKNTH